MIKYRSENYEMKREKKKNEINKDNNDKKEKDNNNEEKIIIIVDPHFNSDLQVEPMMVKTTME